MSVACLIYGREKMAYFHAPVVQIRQPSDGNALAYFWGRVYQPLFGIFDVGLATCQNVIKY